MKKLLLVLAVLTTSLAYSQKIATTEDGKKVMLKDDKTWEYSNEKTSELKCGVDANFVEPKSDKSIYKMLKMVDATTDDLKKHVAVENEVSIKDVLLLSISEQKGNGIYILCVKGKKMKYRRTGSVFSRLDENILKPEN